MNQRSLRKLRSLIVALSMSALSACSMSTPDYKSVVSDPDRPANERELDAARKPDEVLSFYGVKSGDKVADLWAGRGYYTAILSQVDRKSTRLNSSHVRISYAVFCLK